MKKRKGFFKKFSVALFSTALLCNLGMFGLSSKQVHARPTCMCPNPEIETIYQGHGFTRIRCNNCGWTYDIIAPGK